MKNIIEIKNYFEGNLKKEIGELEERRLAVIRRYSFKPYRQILKVLLVLIVLAIAARMALPDSPLVWGTLLVPATGLFAIVYPIVIVFMRKGKFNAIIIEYKQKVLRKMLAFIDPAMSYQPSSGIDPRVIKDSLIFKGFRVPVFESEDLVTLKANELPVKMAGLTVSKISRQRDGQASTDNSFFSGIFLYAELPHPCRSSVVIETDPRNSAAIQGGKAFLSETAGALLNQVFDAAENLNADGNNVQMEDAEFEKYFSVFSSDADEAKLTITPSLRSTLINYAQQTRHGFQVSFTGNYLNIAIASPGLFSWDINSSFLNFAKFEEYFFHLLIAIGAVNTIYQSSQKTSNR